MDNARLAAVLTTTADLLEQDDTRCIELYGAPVGQPVSMVDHLIWRACIGPFEEWREEWDRIYREQGASAAAAWSADQEAVRRQAFKLIFPRGIHSPAATAASVRALAAELSAEPEHARTTPQEA
ncbi:hypothetical protein ACFYPN_16140 [Streptomyces sp. NPDC005576]|uniref:hypothetical protein n=1 Tax=unclassified Streptomyces TaxID=2593676 RepID=UPI0033F8A08A